jgi:hypothetical protein
MIMGLDEERLFYHGPVKRMKEAVRLAKAFPGGIEGDGGQRLYFDIEMGMDWLHIYPAKSYHVKTVTPPKEDLEYLACHSDSVGFKMTDGNQYQVWFGPKKSGFT